MIKIKKEFDDLYECRNILKSLITKNLVGKYRNSLLGFSWHFVAPLLFLVIYYIVFTQIRVNPIPNFWIYLASGLFPFNFVINNVTTGSGCIVGNSGLVKKMYFPREIIVLSQVISTFVIMLIGYIAVLIVAILSGYGVNYSILLLPALLILTFIFTLGLVLTLSAITVYIRDVQHFLSTTSMVFFFLTPMYFQSETITGFFKTIVSINPLTYYIESFHDILYYQSFPTTFHFSMILIISFISIIIGIITFRKLKIGFAERL